MRLSLKMALPRDRPADTFLEWKDTSFAAGVNRSVVEKGAAMLGLELRELVSDTTIGMREVADKISL